MSQPMLVIHGVANRDSKRFEETVWSIQNQIEDRWHLIPVYWGDLGGKTEGLFDSLFDIATTSEEEESIDELLMSFSFFDEGDRSGFEVRSEDAQITYILAGFSADSDSVFEIRSEAIDNSIIAQAIREELPETNALKFIQQPDSLMEIGKLMASALEDSSVSPFETYTTRGGEGRDPFSTTDTKKGGIEKVRSVIHSIDRFTGKFLGNTLGKINQNTRRAVGVQLVHFLGDVLKYQGGKSQFHQRVRDVIESRVPGWGTEAHPINVLAHSLGGVLSFDAAVLGQPPLWINNFITLGSQSSFFHIVDPRHTLSSYAENQPVVLPRQIRRWFNLWEPLDFLAFRSEQIFRLSKDQEPKDIAVFSSTSRILSEFGNTHGVYWDSEELIKLLRNLPYS